METKIKEINGVKFRVTQLGGLQGLETMILVVKMFAPVATAQINIGEMSEATMVERLLVRAASGFGEFLQRVEVSEVMTLVDTFIPVTSYTKGGDWVQLSRNTADLLFAGKQTDLIAWLGFCLELNYPDFLGENSLTISLWRRASEMIQTSASRYQNTSDGSGRSGESSQTQDTRSP